MNTALTARTPTDGHVELAVDRFDAWNLSLILRCRSLEDDVPDRPAARATLRQRRIIGLIDTRRNGAVCVETMAVAALASRWFGIGLRFPRGERSGLALAGAPDFLHELLEMLNFALESFEFRA